MDAPTVAVAVLLAVLLAGLAVRILAVAVAKTAYPARDILPSPGLAYRRSRAPSPPRTPTYYRPI